MSDTKIHIIGIGDNGIDSLNPTALTTLESCDVICGGNRHINMIDTHKQTHCWISPFIDNIAIIENFINDGKTVAILGTGDVSWFGVSNIFIKHFGADKIEIHNSIGAFSLSASELKWSMQDCLCLSIHGRDINQIRLYAQHNQKIILLTNNENCPVEICNILQSMGMQNSTVYILNDLGNDNQSIQQFTADNPQVANSKLNTVAIDCVGKNYSRANGLANNAFIHDGQLTKQEVRSITISALQPYNNAVLWDIGAGNGSIAIEWARFGGISYAIEHDSNRCENIKQNAINLGVDNSVNIINKTFNDCNDLPQPDCIFIGGGITNENIINTAIESLPINGILVANTVTAEGEIVLYNLHKTIGGKMRKISIDELTPVGGFNGWKSAMGVSQYIYTKEQ